MDCDIFYTRNTTHSGDPEGFSKRSERYIKRQRLIAQIHISGMKDQFSGWVFYFIVFSWLNAYQMRIDWQNSIVVLLTVANTIPKH